VSFADTRSTVSAQQLGETLVDEGHHAIPIEMVGVVEERVLCHRFGVGGLTTIISMPRS